MSRIIIENGTIVNEGVSFKGYLVIDGERISATGQGEYRGERSGTIINADGNLVIPGVIDDQVHFREPGLTHKGTIETESRAAVAGGVTSFMDMPNTSPPTTTYEELEKKLERAAETSYANYSFYLGATNNNIAEILKADPRTVCGVKVFMGSSTGNMLVDDERALSAIFAESPLLIATHCEDERTIRATYQSFYEKYNGNLEAWMHPLIRSAEACYRSSSHAVELADKYGSDLHVLHLSTGRELALFDSKPLTEKRITAEVCVHHLWFSDMDHAAKGNFIKWNPSIKSEEDRSGLREGLLNGKLDIVATDHAPHTLEEKSRPYIECPSGGPMVQHSLSAMLELCRNGVLPVELVIEKMCHAPAVRYGIKERGFIREGCYADIAIVDMEEPYKIGPENILYKCGWSPLTGTTLNSKVTHTIINGCIVYESGKFTGEKRAMLLEFCR